MSGMRPSWPTPVGWIALSGCRAGIREISLSSAEVGDRATDELPGDILLAARRQVDEYFAGRRRRFDLPLLYPAWSPFALHILESLRQIPYGSTVSYGRLAALAGHPGAARAVGGVMARNPFPLILPCHRVIGAGGRLTGYSGGAGIASKEWLLRFEAEMVKKSSSVE